VHHISRLFFGPSQWMILVTIVLLVLLSVGYIERLTFQVAMRAELEQWERRVEEARLHQALLEEQFKYVQTDAYVDQQARTVFRWVRPGDVPVVIIPESSSQATRDQEEQRDRVVPPWQKWWDLFFGSEVPGRIDANLTAH